MAKAAKEDAAKKIEGSKDSSGKEKVVKVLHLFSLLSLSKAKYLPTLVNTAL